jgi:predicted amidophosphoribosyltransferase
LKAKAGLTAMALHKCPRCELNYIREEEQYCDVCRRELKRAQARGRQIEDEAGDEDEVIICTECGEAPAVRGGELCPACLKEQKRQAELENAADLDEDYDDDSDEDEESADE